MGGFSVSRETVLEISTFATTHNAHNEAETKSLKIFFANVQR